MNKLYLGSVKIEEKTDNSINETEIKESLEETEVAFINDYDLDNSKVITNIDEFNNYSIPCDYMVSYKEARTAIEEKRPFIVAKRGNKRNSVEDIDTIYKSLPKMKIADKSVERIGFVQVYKNPKQVKVKNKKKYRGIANEEFLITKKKAFNQKKIGYLPLNESTTEKDLYVEITTNRGYRWILTVFIVLGLLGLFVSAKDWDGWKYNKEKFTLYKVQETVQYKESALNIGFNATPLFENNSLDILLTSEYAEGISYKAMLYDENNNLIYESKEIQAGQGLEVIYLDDKYTSLSDICILKCETYRNGKYIGTVESDIMPKIKGE